jgi:hypothetical protein
MGSRRVKNGMVVKPLGDGRYTALSTDTKPTTVPDKTELIETNTRRTYYFDVGSTSWIRQELPTYQRFRIYKEGSNTVIINNVGNKVAGPTTDTAAAVQSMLDQMISGSIWEFDWDNIWWQLENPILFPSVTGTNVEKVIFKGMGHMTQRATVNQATLIEPTVNFPNGKFLFSCQNEGETTPKTSMVFIDGFTFYNGLPQGTKDVSGILYEAGNIRNGHLNWGVSNCFFHYMFTGLALRGLIWWGEFNHLMWTISSTGWLGDACIEIGSAGHSGGFGPSPKNNLFYNIQTGSGSGQYNAFIDMTSGSGNYFDKVFVDGKYYEDAAIYMNNTDYPDGGPIAYNVFRDFWTLDMSYPTPYTTLAMIYMHGGVGGSGGNVSSNRFINCQISSVPVALKMDDANVFKNDIELVSYWGSQVAINDTGSGVANTVTVRPGVKPVSGPTEVPIIHTGGVSRVIDMRKESQNGGLATSISDGSTINHGLMATPVWIFVQSSVAGEFASVTARSSTNFTVALKKHDNTPGTLQGVYWRAGVYG